MNALSYFALLKATMPEAILSLGALAVLGADLGVMRRERASDRRLLAALIAVVVCVGAGVWMLAVPMQESLLGGAWLVDLLTQRLKLVILALTAGTILISLTPDFTEHVGEYFALVLMASAGLLLLVSAADLLLIFVSLELTSLSLYALTALDSQKPDSKEAALKYFFFGGLAAAFTLFGLSLVYGLTGATQLHAVGEALKSAAHPAVLVLALVLVLAGFAFKVAAAPFHLWAPDAYQGAPTPVAALIGSGSKVAGFFVLAKVLMLGFAPLDGSVATGAWEPGWAPLLTGLAMLSMLIGNLAAIAQSSVKRLLAYSAVAHAGYVLLAVIANDGEGLAALAYYVATYGLAVIGAFGVVTVIEEQEGSDHLKAFAGLSRRSPLLAGCLLVFLLSLAGIPPLAGFFGKFYVFAALLKSRAAGMGAWWLVMFAIALSTVSLYYYLKVLKQVYVAPAREAASTQDVSWLALAPILLMAAGVVGLGILPDLLAGPFAEAVRLVGF